MGQRECKEKFIKKSKKQYGIVLIIFLLFAIWVVWGNTALELNEYEIKGEDLPESFDGFRIAQVSDLHNAEMGKNNSKLLDMLKEAEPDIIVMTGDMIDSRNTDIAVALKFVKQAVEIAPCYYVTGNHESRVSRETYLDFEEKMKMYGVQVLHNESVLLERDGEHITLAGLDDSTFAYNHNGIRYSNLSNLIQELYPGDGFQILLSHRPELFETYVKSGVDMVFTGHAHGGQFRLPFVGGLVAPNQGFFPEYDAGLFSEDGTNMLVSRGIGNSIFPVRINNRPEVVVVELSK